MKWFLIFFFYVFCFQPTIGIAQSVSISYNSNSEEDVLKVKNLIPLIIEGVYEYGAEDGYLVKLIKKEAKGEWSLFMVIGDCEAKAISRSIYKLDFSRPLTYDLFNNIFEATSLELKHVVITKLESGTFFANLVIDDGGKLIQVDARPSDCINISMKMNVPMYATKKVWEEAKEKNEE